jgi:hypothetical protein
MPNLQTIQKGLGFSSYGFSSYGFGSPSIYITSKIPVFITSSGTQGNAASINPTTGDFNVDSSNNIQGDNFINQKVILALGTGFNTSVLANFGLDLSSIQTVTQNIQLKVNIAVKNALSALVSANQIAINNIIVSQTSIPNRININVQWTNLLTNQQTTTSVV